MPAKKVIVALLIIVVAIGGFVAGLVLLRQRQDLREEAAVPTGEAEVSIQPESGSFEVGDTISTSVFFDTANIAISGVAVRLTYPFSGSTPEVTVSSIEVNPSLLGTGDWTCPTQNSTQQGGNVVIDIACANTSAAGFTADTNTLLANVDLRINRAPATSPLVVSFDSASSIITRKSNNEDILLIPTSTGTYTIAGAGTEVEATPTPTTAEEVTPTPTSTTTLTPTPTSTVSATATPTPTTSTTTKGGEELPDAGVPFPTIFGAGLGVLTILGALLLAF